MTLGLDATRRGDVLDRLAGRTYDVLVVGGGITGVGVALDAAARGLSVALVERDDLAAGTSSRSSSLVHGGLRYLAHGDVRVVRSSTVERDLLLRLAPHLVRPLEFVIPRSGRDEGALLGAGLTLYDGIALPSPLPRHRRISADELRMAAPGLVGHTDHGGWSYWDAQTDDARLVVAVAQTAAGLGTDVLTRGEVVELMRAGSRVIGATVLDRLGGGLVDVQARWTVAATGVWAGAGALAAPAIPQLVPSKGAHLCFRPDDLHIRAATVVPSAARDGRSVFLIPSGGHVTVGTTDERYQGPLDLPVVSDQDAAYLCDAVNAAFGTRLGPADAVGAWAGLRPLLAGSAAGSERLSRRHTIVESPEGLLTVTGGKLTTYRRMAADVVDRIAATVGGRGGGRSATAQIPLGLRGDLGAAIGRARGVAQAYGVDTAVADVLVRRHGERAAHLLALAAETGETGDLVPGLDLVEVEARWAVTGELALGVEDVLTRRLRVATRDPAAGGPAIDRIAQRVASMLGRDRVHADEDAAAYRRVVAAERGPVPLEPSVGRADPMADRARTTTVSRTNEGG